MIEIPKSIKLEHEELHDELEEATLESGPIGEAAKAVSKLLEPHFVKEEEFALPPLGLLINLSTNQATSEMKDAQAMASKLKAEYNQMLKEHKEIVSALRILTDIAVKEDRLEYVRFAEKLTLHAQTEEEVLYPATILIGDYLKLVLKQ